MNKKFLALIVANLAIAFVCSGMAYADGLSVRERADLQTSFKQSCQKRMNERIAQNPIPPSQSSFAGWLSDLGFSSEYCDCSASEFASQVTPTLLQAGHQDELKSITRKAALKCLLPRAKKSFPKFCHGAVREIALTLDSVEPTEVVSSKVCGCIQEDVAALTDESFPAFATASSQDHARYVASGNLPVAGHGSFLSSMRRCGVEKIKLSLQPAGDSQP